MPTPKIKDEALVASLAGHLVDAMSMFPKRLVRTDELIHTFGMPLSHMQILVMLEKGDMSIGQLSVYTGPPKSRTRTETVGSFAHSSTRSA